MKSIKFAGMNTTIELPDDHVCVQIVADIGHVLLAFSDCHSAEHRAYMLDQIARRVFQGQYEVFIQRCAVIDGAAWPVGTLPQWEGDRDEAGEPLYGDGSSANSVQEEE